MEIEAIFLRPQYQPSERSIMVEVLVNRIANTTAAQWRDLRFEDSASNVCAAPPTTTSLVAAALAR